MNARKALRRLMLAVALSTAVPAFAAPRAGEPAPELDLPVLGANQSVALTDFRGEVVYVDFWAAWCGPCRQSLPLYEDLQQRLADQPFRVLAVNLDEDPEEGLDFLRRHPVSYVSLSDPQGESAARWELPAMPTSFLVGRDGTILNAYIGFKPEHIDEIEHDIRAALENPGGRTAEP